MKKEHLDDILERLLTAKESNISDLNFTPMCSPQVEYEGSLSSIEIEPSLAGNKLLSPFQTASIVSLLIAKQERCWQSLKETGSCDLAYQLRKIARFRVNIFSRRGSYSIVLRKLETEIPTLKVLQCPEIFKKVIMEKTGLVLVTGATGSGKSTTLAGMLRHLNESQAIHIVTLEDPIEFVHPNMTATFNQREMGSDFDTFPNALRAALRQAPKVILVGEMRDRQTLEIGLKAAETGHLVISTLHTVDAGQTINRIVGMFDKDQEEQIRVRLSETLRWVICQRLLKKEGGGRVACHEIMGSNLRTVELIQQGEDETKTYFSVITSSEAMGWKTFETSFLEAYQKGEISEENAILNSTRKNIIRQKIDFVKSQKGKETSDIKELKVDDTYQKKIEQELFKKSGG